MPIMYVVAGPNGAGKSTYASGFVPKHLEFVNPDQIFKGILRTNPNATDLDGWKQVAARIDRNIDNGDSFVWETTLAGKTAIPRIHRTREKGFKIHLIYVALDGLDRHYERVAVRAKKGGHDIPAPDIQRRFQSSYANLPQALALADRAAVYDNSGSRPYRPVLKVQKGEITYIAENLPAPVKESLHESALEVGCRIKIPERPFVYEISVRHGSASDQGYTTRVRLSPNLSRREVTVSLNQAARKFVAMVLAKEGTVNAEDLSVKARRVAPRERSIGEEVQKAAKKL